MNQAHTQGRLLRPDQVADLLNISRAGVYRLVAEGQFLALKIRGSLRIWESSISDYLLRQVALAALENGEPE
jgi:excisionase family DNA binding protein